MRRAARCSGRAQASLMGEVAYDRRLPKRRHSAAGSGRMGRFQGRWC
ncbi:hypothetical protein FRUB_03702 [Fimbriiglobus ruber]|uniref:Uncharacterized protein n=1 Tax=Fimbriiglobus ruber TaxID=1908690 RepID=A0A225DPQ9_9BACT|nr:hypothetical protein FRUB_03702 [Fimbriiglobus ruber]